MIDNPDPLDIDGPLPTTEREPAERVADPLSCPDGYPPDEWAILHEGNKRAYLYALAMTAKLTGGE
jgi:hypothetical protein